MQSSRALYRAGAAGGPHVRAGCGAKAGGSRVQAEGTGKAMRPRDVGAGNEDVVENREARDTSRRGRPDARISPKGKAISCGRLF